MGLMMNKIVSFITILTLIGFLQPMPLSLAKTLSSTTTVYVQANQPWTDTGVDLVIGSTVTITASGLIKVAGSDPGKSPDGAPCGSPPGFPAPSPCWSLIGEIENGIPFFVGSSIEFTAEASGRFYLGVNDEDFGDNSGIWTATIIVTPPAIPSVKMKMSRSNGIPVMEELMQDPESELLYIVKLTA
jgi:hypothetical protein